MGLTPVILGPDPRISHPKHPSSTSGSPPVFAAGQTRPDDGSEALAAI